MAIAQPTARDNGRAIGPLAVVVVIVAVLVLVLTGTTDRGVYGTVLLAPILVAITVPALRRQAEREGDARVFTILFAALVLKLIAAVARHFVAFTVYSG